jgi:hypothetical protein
MKKGIIVGSLAFLLIASGVWWLAKRPQGAAQTAEADRPLFEVTAQGSGSVLQVNPPGPLRRLAWLRPLPGGRGLCFLSTQADQQILGLFRNGDLERSFPMPVPEGMDASYYRKATLQDAAFVGPSLYLLMGDEDHPKEPALLLQLDPSTGALKAFQRGAGQRLAPFGDRVLLYGPEVPALRVAFRGKRAEAAAFELPPEIKAPEAMLAIDGEHLLVAHREGLSAYAEGAGWKHTPRPAREGLSFPAAHAVLVRAGKAFWWQPQPGQAFEVDAQGSVLRELDLAHLPGPESSLDLDRGLLALLGADAKGQLWFGLAAPDISKAAPAPQASNPQEEGWTNEAPSAPAAAGALVLTEETRAALEAHLKRPMDRIYRLSADGTGLAVLSWTERWPALQAPADLPRPQGDGALAPEGGAFLLGDGLKRWWLPLQSVAP